MSSMPALRGVNAIEIDAISRPARTFTGDFYFTHRHEDRVWLALGDVAGKGLPAAIVMAMIQEELEERIAACAETLCDPARTIGKLHDFLLPLMPQNRFATAVIATLRDDGRLTLANGGHCPPLIVRADGTIEELASTGPILGLLPNARWRTVTTTLDYGDALVLYSDGVTEATLDGEELGVCGLRRIARKATTAQGILDALATYAHGDDTTVVVVRRMS
ncbi:MAG TPA: PP2C family protein-serine/threonine phosphatase [Thermoanaerobaculia bacterium]|nr:PP2C family protein-serine/threonine phosphatase [Thermoanaerobaculia bacterium]